MHSRVVAPADWPAFLRSFGDRHRGWLVRLAGSVDTPPRDFVALRELQIGDDGDLVLHVGEVDDPIELHFADPRIVRVTLTADGVERGLSIDGRDGELTLGFRTAIAPELVDGPPL